MAEAIQSARKLDHNDLDAFSRLSLPYSSSSTGSQTIFSSSEISGASLNKGKRRRRPGKFTRIARTKQGTTTTASSSKNPTLKVAGQVKRKAETELKLKYVHIFRKQMRISQQNLLLTNILPFLSCLKSKRSEDFYFESISLKLVIGV
ncbi:hypothetical protein YC2023_061332 [Brassica napus]